MSILRTKLTLYICISLFLMVISVVLGINVGLSFSSPEIKSLIIENPLLPNTHPIGTPQSEAGFTGFESGGITGEVFASGLLTEIYIDEIPKKILFRSNGRESAIEYLEPSKFFIIEGSEILVIGDQISVNIKNGKPHGVLRITHP